MPNSQRYRRRRGFPSNTTRHAYAPVKVAVIATVSPAHAPSSTYCGMRKKDARRPFWDRRGPVAGAGGCRGGVVRRGARGVGDRPSTSRILAESPSHGEHDGTKRAAGRPRCGIRDGAEGLGPGDGGQLPRREGPPATSGDTFAPSIDHQRAFRPSFGSQSKRRRRSATGSG